MKSKCTLCGLGARTTLIVIGLWTLLQSFVYIGLSATAILTHLCQIDMSKSSFLHLFYIIFFRDKECGPDRFEIFFENLPPNIVLPSLPDVTHVAYRTYILAISYALLSLLWIISSILLIAGAYIFCLGRTGFYIFCVPWILITIGNIAVDITAATFFVFDLVNSFNFVSLFSWLGVQNVANTAPFFEDLNTIALPLPSAIMIFVASRGLVIFILNVICFFIVLSAGLWLSKEISSTRSSYSQPLPNANLASNSAETRYNDYAREQRNDYIDPTLRRDTNDSNQNSKNSNYDYENRGFMGDGDSSNNFFTQKSNENHSSVRRTVEKLKGGEEVLSQSSASSGLGKSQTSTMEKQDKKIPPPIAPKPRYNNQNQHPNDSGTAYQEFKTDRMEELRSQRPWSYFQNPDAVRKPSAREDSSDNPPIPVPDYTLHFPKKERTTSIRTGNNYNQNFNSPNWTGQDDRR